MLNGLSGVYTEMIDIAGLFFLVEHAPAVLDGETSAVVGLVLYYPKQASSTSASEKSSLLKAITLPWITGRTREMKNWAVWILPL